MSKIKLMPHQQEALEQCKDRNRVAFYHSMGLGKTYVGAEKLRQLGAARNLVICQKSKVRDWVEHFETYYPDMKVIDYTKAKFLGRETLELMHKENIVIVINYELVWRRAELKHLQDITLMLDESSLIQNETAKRSRFILNSLDVKNVILLSGTPTSGRYERLWSQCRLLGWHISKRDFYNRYVIEQEINTNTSPFPIKIVVGYKNVEELKEMLRKYGCHFLKTEDVLSLPEQTFVNINVEYTLAYRRFKKDRIVNVEGKTLVGDTVFTKMLYERMLCSQYNKAKLEAFTDVLESTEDRLIVFYNFKEELVKLKELAKRRPISEVNGDVKDLTAYNERDNAITFVQYQAGAMGLNLQKANKIVYFSLPLSSELFEQSKKRTHRIGQTNTCFYYTLICQNSIEEKILNTLKMRKNYTERLFEEDEKSQKCKESKFFC